MEIYCLRSIGGYRAREKGLVNVSTNMRFVLLIWELRVFIANIKWVCAKAELKIIIN